MSQAELLAEAQRTRRSVARAFAFCVLLPDTPRPAHSAGSWVCSREIDPGDKIGKENSL